MKEKEGRKEGVGVYVDLCEIIKHEHATRPVGLVSSFLAFDFSPSPNPLILQPWGLGASHSKSSFHPTEVI